MNTRETPNAEMQCGKCGESIHYPAAHGGRVAICPKCSERIRLKYVIDDSSNKNAAKDNYSEERYVDMMIGQSPIGGILKENSGMDVDLTKLTVAGWCLAVITVTLAAVGVFVPSFLLSSSQTEVSRGVVRAIGIPIALVIGIPTFWISKQLLRKLSIPITRE